MRRRARRVGVGAVLVGVVLAGGAWCASRAGAVWNGSESLPFGLYWRLPGSASRVRPGDYVVACAPAGAERLALARGYVPHDDRNRGCGGSGDPLLKRVYGVSGDRYEVEAYGVLVNGALVRNSAPLRWDAKRRALWDGRSRSGVLGAHQLLVLSNYNPASYDSRYFGPLDEASVLARVTPVLTAGSDRPS